MYFIIKLWLNVYYACVKLETKDCTCFYRKQYFQGNAHFVQKATFEPLMGFKQNQYGSWNITKTATFKKYSSPKLQKHTNTFFHDSEF